MVSFSAIRSPRFAQPRFQLFRPHTQHGRDPRRLLQVLLQLLLAEPGSPRPGVDATRDPLPVLRHDDAFAFQFQICPLDGDDADLKIHASWRMEGIAWPSAQSPTAIRCLICSMIWR